MEEWNNCVDFLAEDLNLTSNEEAEQLLATGLQWKRWAKAPSYRPVTPELPNLERLQSALKWLREGPLAVVLLGEGGNDDDDLDDDHTTSSHPSELLLLQAINANPNLYLVDPSTRYQEAFESAPSEYQDSFLSLVAQDPSVLKYNYNCYACTNDCDKCWAFYELQKSR